MEFYILDALLKNEAAFGIIHISKLYERRKIYSHSDFGNALQKL